MTPTLDHVVVVHILIWDKRKSRINEYIYKWSSGFSQLCSLLILEWSLYF
jgi:hypothetical protein